MITKQERLECELEEAKKNAPLAFEEEEDEEDESQKQMESDLAKRERQRRVEEQKK